MLWGTLFNSDNDTIEESYKGVEGPELEFTKLLTIVLKLRQGSISPNLS